MAPPVSKKKKPKKTPKRQTNKQKRNQNSTKELRVSSSGLIAGEGIRVVKETNLKGEKEKKPKEIKSEVKDRSELSWGSRCRGPQEVSSPIFLLTAGSALGSD